jgi:hypothetical protein
MKNVVSCVGKSVAGESEKRGQTTPFCLIVMAKPRIKWCCILLPPS